MLVLVGLCVTAVGVLAFRSPCGDPLAGAPPAFPRGVPPPTWPGEVRRITIQNSATTVTTYVQRVLAPRVLELEVALATANRQVLAYCAPRGQAISVCFEGTVNVQDSALLALGLALDTQSLVLTHVSADIASLPVPDVGAPLPSWQADRLIEDLASGSAQLAALLQDYATAIKGAEGAPLPTGGEALRGLAYAGRVRSLAGLLRRAEGWLETIDHETGAHVTLPGFAPGAASVDSVLVMQ
jgi:hypothetical protein